MLDKLKSLFFEKVDGDKKTPDQSAVDSENTDIANDVEENIVVTPVTSQIKGEVDDKLLGVLSAAIATANIDGFDYLEYKESLKSLEKMDMSKATRFQSAFAMAKTMGANPERLIQSAEYYLGILKDEHNKFAGVIDNQRQAKIGDKGNIIAQMEQLVQDKLQQIEKIKGEIKELNDEIAKEQNSISTAQTKIENTLMNFEATYQTIYGSIVDDIANMKSYLK